MYEEAKTIDSFDSWTQVSAKIIKLADELHEQCRHLPMNERRRFVHGGLVALNGAYGWDMKTQPEETENMVLWMFVQLYVR